MYFGSKIYGRGLDNKANHDPMPRGCRQSQVRVCQVRGGCRKIKAKEFFSKKNALSGKQKKAGVEAVMPLKVYS